MALKGIINDGGLGVTGAGVFLTVFFPPSAWCSLGFSFLDGSRDSWMLLVGFSHRQRFDTTISPLLPIFILRRGFGGTSRANEGFLVFFFRLTTDGRVREEI